MLTPPISPDARGHIDRELWARGLTFVGVDEVGRGCLAGPVVAAAVILDPVKFSHLSHLEQNIIRDSKTLSVRQRAQAEEIVKQVSLSLGIGSIPAREIERLGILPATFAAMKAAITQISVRPDYILVDGNQAIPDLDIPQKPLVKGDFYSYAIAAASIIAKNYRDAFMVACDNKYPGYGFKNHVGYGTKEHLRSLEKLGISPLHRRNFAPVRNMLSSPIA